MIPAQIVKQYKSFCYETNFAPKSRSTLCRTLQVCSTSVRKSFQGLDYVSAEGAKAFDDLADVTHAIGTNHVEGASWEKNHNEKLKQAKRYFKGDYKVSYII